MEAIKIDNGLYVQKLREPIKKFCRIVNIGGFLPENFAAYLSKVCQFGGDVSEFWVVFEDNAYQKPIAFATWNILGEPHTCSVYCQAIHAWSGDTTQACELLLKEFVKFGDKHNATFWSCDVVGEARERLFSKRAKGLGFKYLSSNVINCKFSRR